MTSMVFTLDRTDTTTVENLTWEVVGAGTYPADATDFVGGALPSGTLSYSIGTGRATITVQVNPDLTVEHDETYDVIARKGGVEVARARGTIVNDDVAPGTDYIVYGDVADATAIRYVTSRPLIARGGNFRDGTGVDQDITFKVGMIDANNFAAFRVHLNDSGGFCKLLSYAIVNGAEKVNGFGNVDLPVDITNSDVSVELNADGSVAIVQIATADSKTNFGADGVAVTAGTRKVLFTFSAAGAKQAALADALGNGVQVVRTTGRDFGSGKAMKRVATGTPA